MERYVFAKWASISLAFYLVLGMLVGCSSAVDQRSELTVPVSDVTKHLSYSDGVRFTQKWVDQVPHRGVGIGFVWAEYRDLPPDQRPQTEEVRLEKGETFNPFLVLFTEKPIVSFLDFHQMALEGRDVSIVHLDPDEEASSLCV